jgi:hypothetical protein
MKVPPPTDRQLSALVLRTTPKTFSDVGEELGITMNSVRNLCLAAIWRLKDKPDHPAFSLISKYYQVGRAKSSHPRRPMVSAKERARQNVLLEAWCLERHPPEEV